MLKVGITGGIGAGKSVVCQVFKTLGIPVFDADATAKYLTEHDSELVTAIKELFGADIYSNGTLNREKVGERVFKQPELLEKLNAVIHPATIAYGEKWMSEQATPYAVKEAAIFFETGSNKGMDVMIGVSAPDEIRIKRALQRPGMTREKITARMANQMPQEEKMNLCDYVIINDGNSSLIAQVLEIHQSILNRATNS